MSSSYSQVSNYTIYGESLWRNQGYGVTNHQFDIENYIIPLSTNYPLSPDPITDDCPYEVYTSEIMPLYSANEDAQANTLKIRPYSVNDEDDYRNGVSTLDLVAIAAHLEEETLFEDRTPTEDFPFRYISADADNDMNVDEDDIDMIQDLILFYRDDLERDSWEWVHKDEIEQEEQRFEEDPYEFVISYNWPGDDGIILPALSTNEIEADNDKFFTFRTTKIGDIIAVSGSAVSLNDWVCGSGEYVNGGEFESRSSASSFHQKVRAGSVITIGIDLYVTGEILALELPLHFSDEELRLLEIQFSGGFQPKWHRNTERGALVILDYHRDLSPVQVSPGRIMELKLVAIRDIPDVGRVFGWLPGRVLEVIGMEEEMLPAEVYFELTSLTPPDLYMEVRAGNSAREIYIESPADQWMQLQWIRDNGILASEEYVELIKGGNHIPIKTDLVPGMYFLRLNSEDRPLVTKVFIR